MPQLFILLRRLPFLLFICMAAAVARAGGADIQDTISPLGLDDFIAVGCEVERPRADVIRMPVSVGKPCTLILQRESLRQLPEDGWFSVTTEVSGMDSIVMNMMYWSTANTTQQPELINSTGLFPELRARLSFPLKVLAEGRGVPKTPGTLIPFSFGKGVAIEEWSRMALSPLKLSGDDAVVELTDFRFTRTQPDYPVPDGVVIDAMGQWAAKDFKDKVNSTTELNTALNDEASKKTAKRDASKYSQYGGTRAVQFESTGFFRTHHDGKRWWLVDPQGYAFYSVGIDIIGPGISGNVDGIEKLHALDTLGRG